MAGILLRLRTWWETADRTQRAVTLFGGGFLLLLLLGTFYFASRPKMEMAFGGLTAAEQGTVVAEIQKMGIPVEFDLAGNVTVPSSKVSEVKMRLASSGNLPAAAHWGYSDLKDFSLMTTPRVEKERLKSVMEGELAKTIEFIDSVESARVHITLGEDSTFANEKKPATASVTISGRGDSAISPEQGKAISRLVSNAVPGLSPQNITIVDKNLQPIWMGDTELGANGRATERLQAEITEARRRERELQGKMDYFFGQGAAVVTVDLRLDFDTATEKKTEPIVGDQPVTEAKVKETMSGSSTGPGGGGAGLNGNDGQPGEPPIDGNSNKDGYSSEQKQADYAVGSRETQTQKSPGEVKSMSITVLVDKKKVPQFSQVQDFVNNYLGPRLADTENFTAKVTAVEREPVLESAAAKAAEAAAGRDRIQQILSMLPIAALMLVAFLVLKGLGKAAKSQNVMVAALPGGRTMPMALSAGSDSSGEIVRHDEGREPRMSPAAIRQQAEQDELDDLPEITAKINKPLEQIKRMSADRPEVVAMLIKSWLLEERR
jgi:flagellar M-ring protein FliF